MNPTYIQWKGWDNARGLVFPAKFHVVEVDGDTLVVVSSHRVKEQARKSQAKHKGTGIIFAWFEPDVQQGGTLLHPFDWVDDPRCNVFEDPYLEGLFK